MYIKKRGRTAITVASIIIGNALLAFLVAAFIIPHDIIMGGTTGIGIVLGKLLHFDTAVFILALNVILLIVGLVALGKKFFLSTVASSLLYPAFLELFQRIPGIDSLTDDPLLAAIFAGVLMGISLGLVMRVGSSTGGMDVVNLVMNKFFHRPVSLYVYLTDFIVIGGQAIFAKPQDTLLGLLVLALETLALDKVMIIGKSQMQLFVISSKYDEIRTLLLTKLEAGVTMTMIETGCLGETQKGVLCVIPQRKLYAATELINSVDPNAFTTVTKINEVRGRGFTKERETEIPKF